MKINKEQEVKTEIHKKGNGKIHKKKETKIDNKSSTTRARRSATLVEKITKSAITENVEGGENIAGALAATGIAIRPVKGAISACNRIRKKVSTSKLQKEVAGKRIRKKASTKGKELAKKSAKNASKNVAKKTSKKVVKDTTKEVTKEGTKLAVKAGTTVAGSAAGPEGTVIGMAAGEAVGAKIEKTFYRAEQKSRMMKYFMDKTKPYGEQNDSLLKLAGSLIKNKVAYMIKQVVSLVAPILIVVMVATGIVFAIIAVLYNSPFSIFLPPLESGDTIK